MTTSGPWLIWVMSLIATSLGLYLHLQNRAGGDQSIQAVGPAVALAFPWIGAVIASRRPANPVGWLYCLGALVGVAFLADQYATRPVVTGSGPLPGGVWLAWVATWAWIPGLLAPLTLGILLFPDGRAPSPRWRPLVWATTALIPLTTLLVALAPERMGQYNLTNPLGVAGLTRLDGDLLLLSGYGLTVACLAGLVVRWRGSSGRRRRQLRALAAAAALALAARVLAVPMSRGTLPLAVYQALGAATLVCVPASVLLAVVKHRLYHFRRSEITRLGNHSIVAGCVLAVSLSTWAVLRALQFPQPLVLAALVIVVEPLRRYLTPAVEDRRRAYRAHTVLMELARRLERSAAPSTVLPTMAETLARSLELPYVAIELCDGSGGVIESCGSGEMPSEVEILDLVHQGKRVARLRFTPPTSGVRLDPGERLLLEEIATHLTVVVYAIGLTLVVQEQDDLSGISRGRPVAAVAFDSGACLARWSLRYRRRRSPVVSVLARRRRAVCAAELDAAGGMRERR